VTRETRKGSSYPAPAKAASVAVLVRRHDRDRYRTALFAPVNRREALFALYAFNYEVARIRESISQLMLGQIRLQWWREVIDAAYAGKPARPHEVVQPLVVTIRNFDLARSHFDRLIDAREHDLTDEPPPSLSALENYAEATSSGLLMLALQVLGVDNPAVEAAARDIGIAYAFAGLLQAMPFHAAAGRSYIPADIVAAAGLPMGDYSALRTSPALRDVVRHLEAVAQARLVAARRLRPKVPRAALPALLPAVIASHSYKRLHRADWNPFDPSLAVPDPLVTWRLASAVLRRAY
jgi:NADH dehydrogenase [ubiquinone] 1 alpha subcomplex assembly factor 6